MIDTKVRSEELAWGYRWPLICRELDAAAADIVCLQEVNRFEECYQPHMEAAGYASAYLQKRESAAAALGFPADGSAIFWNSRRFTCLGEPEGVRFQHRDRGAEMSQGTLSVLLRCAVTGLPILVVCLHLKAKAGAANEQMRLEQAKQALERAEQLLASAPVRQGEPCGLLICGDFNDTPESACLKVLEAKGSMASVWHSRGNTDNGATEPPFTTFKWRGDSLKKAVIDYVWYSTSCLRLESTLTLPSEADIGSNGLPNSVFPSDHLPVVCSFDISAMPTRLNDSEKEVMASSS